MKKALRGLADMGHPLSPDQFDSVMASYAGTQPMRGPSVSVKRPTREAGHLERK